MKKSALSGRPVDDKSAEGSSAQLRSVVYVSLDVLLTENGPEVIGRSLLENVGRLRLVLLLVLLVLLLLLRWWRRWWWWLDVRLLLLVLLIRRVLKKQRRRLLFDGVGYENTALWLLVEDQTILVHVLIGRFRRVVLQDLFCRCRFVPDLLSLTVLNVKLFVDEIPGVFVYYKLVIVRDRDGFLYLENVVVNLLDRSKILRFVSRRPDIL